MKSKIYIIVKRYYDNGIYTKEDVLRFYNAGKITAEEYKEITGEEIPRII